MKLLIALVFVFLAIVACGRKSAEQKISDSLSGMDEMAMFERAQKFEAESSFAEAAQVYTVLADRFPQSPLRYKAIFMRGFIELENLKQPKRAIEAFDLLLKEYPDCDLADDAAYMRAVAASGKDLMSVFQDSLR